MMNKLIYFVILFAVAVECQRLRRFRFRNFIFRSSSLRCTQAGGIFKPRGCNRISETQVGILRRCCKPHTCKSDPTMEETSGTCLAVASCQSAVSFGVTGVSDCTSRDTNAVCCVEKPVTCTVAGTEGTCMLTSECNQEVNLQSSGAPCDSLGGVCCVPKPVKCQIDESEGTCKLLSDCGENVNLQSSVAPCDSFGAVCCVPLPVEGEKCLGGSPNSKCKSASACDVFDETSDSDGTCQTGLICCSSTEGVTCDVSGVKGKCKAKGTCGATLQAPGVDTCTTLLTDSVCCVTETVSCTNENGAGSCITGCDLDKHFVDDNELCAPFGISCCVRKPELCDACKSNGVSGICQSTCKPGIEEPDASSCYGNSVCCVPALQKCIVNTETGICVAVGLCSDTNDFDSAPSTCPTGSLCCRPK